MTPKGVIRIKLPIGSDFFMMMMMVLAATGGDGGGDDNRVGGTFGKLLVLFEPGCSQRPVKFHETPNAVLEQWLIWERKEM